MNKAISAGYVIFVIFSIIGVIMKFTEGWERFTGIYDRFLLIFFSLLALITGWVLNSGSPRVTGCFMTIMKLSGLVLFFLMAFAFSMCLFGPANLSLLTLCGFALIALLFYGLCLLLLWSLIKPAIKPNNEIPGSGSDNTGNQA